MFPNAKPRPTIAVPVAPPAPLAAYLVPEDAKVSFAVRYSGGRKQFDNEADALDFAKVQRSLDKGWAEVSRNVETIVSPRA